MREDFLIARIAEFIRLSDPERREKLQQIEITSGIDSFQYAFYEDLYKFVSRHT